MELTGVRLLLVLPQLPHDAASGAARSARTICELLAHAGCEVHALATTATERGDSSNPLETLRELGIQPTCERAPSKQRDRPEICFTDRGVHYRLLDVGSRPVSAWPQLYGRQFDLLFDHSLHSFRPDVMFGFGGTAGDVRRYQRARRQGVKVVFTLQNPFYQTPGLLDHMDGVLTASQFLADLYYASIGLDSTPIPLPISREDVVAQNPDPIFFTMINPSPEKGLMFMARLAEELGVRRPDIPLLVVESRGSGGRLVQAGLLGGFDLRRHENLMMASTVMRPSEIYGPTRALLVPSVWPEAFGRVSAEALLNGIPPIVSDRGGLPEVCSDAGFVVPIAGEFTAAQRVPVPASAVEPWLELMFRLEDDRGFYETAAAGCAAAGDRFEAARLAPRYVDYFASILVKPLIRP
jgi:glycosyltransferase involved in cell wall biosynthesis